jgi:hypothetical protein
MKFYRIFDNNIPELILAITCSGGLFFYASYHEKVIIYLNELLIQGEQETG